MRLAGRNLSLGLAALACAAAIGFAGCGSDEDEPPGATPGSVLPVGELSGPTVPLDQSGFDPLLALTVEATGEGRTLIAGEIRLSRPEGQGAGEPEVRIEIDGEEASEAEARQVGDDRLVIACGCELEPGEHEVELQGRSEGGVSPIAARGLIALDGVEYATDAPTGGGALPPAINGSTLETDPTLVSGAPTSLAELSITGGSATSENLIVIANVGSTRSSVDPRGIALQTTVADQEATRIATVDAGSSAIDAFTLDATPATGDSVELIGNIVGGGSTELDLVYLISCPCGLETETG
jgi:hypothetical protein